MGDQVVRCTAVDEAPSVLAKSLGNEPGCQTRLFFAATRLDGIGNVYGSLCASSKVCECNGEQTIGGRSPRPATGERANAVRCGR